MKQSLFIFLSGTSGVGKNTIINKIIEKDSNCEFLISHTSRKKRIDDNKGTNYHHVSKSQFENLLKSGDIIEYDMFNDDYYGISKEEINSKNALGKVILKDFSVKGVINAKEILKNKINFINVFLTEKKSTLKKRLLARKYDKKCINNRLNLYKYEQSKIPFYDYLITNDKVEKTVDDVNSIINTHLNNLNILSLENPDSIKDKKIDLLAKRLENKKKIDEIIVVNLDNRIYIVRGSNEYLAHIKTKTPMLLTFSHKEKEQKNKFNADTWEKIVNSYK